MPKVFSLEYKVRDYELDQYGVVNNATYLQYLEHARHEFLHGVGIDPAAVARSGESLALSEIHVQYRRPLRSREHFRIEVTIGQVRGARVEMLQRIVSHPDGHAVLDARAVAVFLDAHGRPRRVSAAHREAFTAYQPEA